MHDQRAEAKRQIQDRIDFYETVQLAKTEDKYLEARVKSAFIAPFLNALGWKPDSNEVYPEYPVGRDKVDYALQAGGVGEEPKIFVEAKKFVLPEGLDSKERDPYTGEDITFPEKAIQYAWRKNVEWVILTNFKELRIYNIKRSKIPRKAEWLRTTYDKYLDKETFETIWAFSREGAASGLLDAFEIRGKRKPVDRQFLEDLIKCRLLLIGDIRRLNKELKPELLKECVQRILDRLVIMRAAEDLGVEKMDRLRMEILKPKEGWDKLNQWLFKNFNERFNSKIFDTHPCDNLKIDDEIIQKVVDILYNGTGESSGYRFDQIRADVLGSMYEDYIGYILKEEGDVFELEREMGKRKAEGIYYTPTYVVEFIVENTLGTLLKDMSPSEVKNIHILDPACGSGSFLTKAQDVLRRYYESTMKQLKKKEGGRIDLYISEEYASLSKDILTKNIYGVDLDSQAAEIASVNLSLKVLADMKKEMKLPEVMGKNIKVGNSLISNHRKDLKKYFERPIEKKPFNWDEEFPHVFEQRGFDVVIGNPPYINIYKLSKEKNEIQYYQESFETAHKKFDLYVLFMQKSIDLMKNGGMFGFIVPDKFMYVPYGEKLRRFILDNCVIEQIVDLTEFKVFPESVVDNVIIILRKEPRKEKRDAHKIKVVRQKENPNKTRRIEGDEYYISQKVFHNTLGNMFRLDLNENAMAIIEKIEKQCIRLGDICVTNKGIVPHSEKISKGKKYFIHNSNPRGTYKKYIEGRNVERYFIDWEEKFLDYQPSLMYCPHFPELFECAKIVAARLSGKTLICSYDRGEYYVSDKVNIIVKKDTLANVKRLKKEEIELSSKYDLKYTLGIINSALIQYYFRILLATGLDVYPDHFKALPIFSASQEQQKSIAKLVSKMQFLSKQRHETLQVFQKILDNVKDSKTKLRPFGKYYFKEGSIYGIDLAKTKKLIDTNLEGKVTAIEIEDEGESLVLKAKYGDEKDFVPVINVHVKDNELRKFFYYTMKTYLMEKIRTKNWGEGKIVDVVLNALEIPRFETNIEMDKGRIRKLMSEFFKSSPIKDKSLSEVGKEIQTTDALINRKVYELYGLREEEIKIIEESLQ